MKSRNAGAVTSQFCIAEPLATNRDFVHQSALGDGKSGHAVLVTLPSVIALLLSLLAVSELPPVLALASADSVSATA